MCDFIVFWAENRPGQSFCFTMDYLNIHKHPVIWQKIHAAGHCIVFQAPYWPCNGVIEYVFSTLHTFLLMDDDAGVMTLETWWYGSTTTFFGWRRILSIHTLFMLVSPSMQCTINIMISCCYTYYYVLRLDILGTGKWCGLYCITSNPIACTFDLLHVAMHVYFQLVPARLPIPCVTIPTRLSSLSFTAYLRLAMASLVSMRIESCFSSWQMTSVKTSIWSRAVPSW